MWLIYDKYLDIVHGVTKNCENREGERLTLNQENRRVSVVLAEQLFDFVAGGKTCGIHAVILFSLSWRVMTGLQQGG